MKVSELMTCDVLSVAGDASLDEAMEMMDAEGVRHLPVVEEERVVGVLSERDLLEVTGWLPKRAREVLEAPTGQVRDFMHSPVVSVSPQTSIVTAALRLIEWNIGCLPVLEDGVLIGMMTEIDVLGAYAKACMVGAPSVESDPTVDEVMTIEVVSADHRMAAEEALEFCRRKNVRHLPVLKGDTLVGIVSDRDLRRCIGRGQLEGTPIGEIAPDELVTIDPDSKLSGATEMLVRHHIGAIPVIESERLIGLITTADVLNHCTQVFATTRGSAGS